MNIEQADLILKKINRLFESMSLDNKVDVFEQDLMLSYVRQLKEAFTGAETRGSTPGVKAPGATKTSEPRAEVKAAPKTPIEKPAPSSTSPKSRQRRSWAFPGTTDAGPTAKTTAPLPDVKKYKPAVKNAPKPAPKIPAPKPQVTKVSKPAPERPTPQAAVRTAMKAIAEKIQTSAKRAIPPRAKVIKKLVPAPKTKAPAAAPSVPGILKPKKSSAGFTRADYEELFDFKDAEELLKIRSQMPIKDLTRVMLSREKKAAIKDLFDGDEKAFDATLKTLDTFKSYYQAKTYLAENIATKYNWLDKSRKGKTTDFIILVRRRYN